MGHDLTAMGSIAHLFRVLDHVIDHMCISGCSCQFLGVSGDGCNAPDLIVHSTCDVAIM